MSSKPCTFISGLKEFSGYLGELLPDVPGKETVPSFTEKQLILIVILCLENKEIEPVSNYLDFSV